MENQFLPIRPPIVLTLELLQDIYAPISFPRSEFWNTPASNSIRTNPTFPPLKSQILPQLLSNERVEYYLYIKNG
ncbi:MAG: hypothetical protein RLZZ628_3080 [Bacteroidota bacterium]|jgi:hypothetical protein